MINEICRESRRRGHKLKRIFICYASIDSKKVTALKNALIGSTLGFEPIIVAQTASPQKALADKMKEGIKRSDYFVPILSREAMNNQWVNQEIGFAEANDKRVFPIVDECILRELKGFIHNQMDLPFTYTRDEIKKKKESLSFRKSYTDLIMHLETSERGYYFKSHIVRKRLKGGESYKTIVRFKGRLKHGFFDNKITPPKGKIMWNWDKQSLPDTQKTAPGMLNGEIDIERQYSCKTSDWGKGKYAIQVGVYQHKIPGKEGRELFDKEIHYLQII